MPAQTINIEVDIEDDFLKIPLSGVKVSVLDTDGTVVADSASCFSIKNRDGILLQEIYIVSVKAQKQDYMIHATKPGYSDVWQPVSVLSSQKSPVKVPTIKMRKERIVNLNEVVVKSTKVKMYYKGDTLVYNADAFKLPDGSMLDDLIRQLPGVTMNNGGEIFVNGRKVDELMLSSRSFFRGNRKILLDNLPYYTVKNIKVYDKQTDKSEALGYDVEPRIYVMDVNLKEENSKGYISNAEAAAGTEKKWLWRGFLLGFTNRWRYSVMGNVNNVNETRHIGERGQWTPGSIPQSLVTTYSAATDLDYESKSKNVKNNFNADFTSTKTEVEMSQWREQFLDGYTPTSLAERYTKSNNCHLKFSNDLVIKKPSYLNIKSNFNMEKRDGHDNTQFDQWGEQLTASMRTYGMGEGKTWSFIQQLDGAVNLNRNKQQYISYGALFWHSDDFSWHSNRFDTWQVATTENEIRHNANDVSNRSTSLVLQVHYTSPDLFKSVKLLVSEQFQYTNTKKHDYLYHPDTLLLASQLDMLTAITDVANSYDSHSRYLRNVIQVGLSKQGTYKVNQMSPVSITYNRWHIGCEIPVIRQSLDYKRGVIDTLIHDTRVFVSPNVTFRHMSSDGKQDFRIRAKHSSEPADILNQVAYRDDSQPLIIKLGNPALKGRSTTEASVDYNDRLRPRQQQWHIGAAFSYHHRDVAQSVSYNPGTGVYTYQPMNVNGAYSATTHLDFSRGIDEKCYWTWQMNTDANYHHFVDYSMLAGEIESHENIVNALSLHNGIYIQYNKDVLYVRASGDVRWQHSEGKMRDFEMLDVFDFNYGLSARYTIPVLKTTVSADATMYCRRGYGSSLDTNDFIINASLSQSLWKGRLVARIDAFDLLHQISSVQHEVNAQGRVDTWYRSLPHYVMFHLTYHWNKNPKKK